MRVRATTAPDREVLELDASLVRQVGWAVLAVTVTFLLLASGVVLLALALLAAAAVVGVRAYLANEVSRDLREPMDHVWISAVRAYSLQGIEFDPSSTRRTFTEGEVHGADSRIRVECHAGGVTRVRVRVGLFPFPDNRRRGALLLEQVVGSFDETQEILPLR